MERIVIDTDPGIDDAQAILMAGVYPEVKLEALTVVAGNVGLEHTLPNSCQILDILGLDIPVFAGCDRALVLEENNAAHVHGGDGLGDVGLPPSTRRVETEHAALALVRLAHEAPGELTLVAIGPLTNLAVALKIDPDLPAKYKRLVIMGGAVYARGNTPHVSAEFNIYADPEAAQIVFSQWPHFTLVSWETTLAHGLPLTILDEWQALGTARAHFFSRISAKLVDFIVNQWGETKLYGADGLAMAVALEPDIVTRADERAVSVELHGRLTRGQTTVDWSDRNGHPPNATIVQSVVHERFRDLMTMALS